MMDPNYKVPEGFNQVLGHDVTRCPGVPIAGLAEVGGLRFHIEDGAPALPLRISGKIAHVEWGTSTKYAIDADGTCWMDDAYGGALWRTSPKSLVAIAAGETDLELDAIRRAAGVEVPMPEWAETALRNGFTAPEGWTWKK